MHPSTRSLMARTQTASTRNPWTRATWLLAAGVVLSGCSNDPGATPPGKPPTPGGLETTSTAAPSPTATPPDPGAAPSPVSPAAPGTAAPSGPGGTAAKGLPEDFEPKKYCSMMKLSTCSIYGARYERLEAITNFCGALGGELTNDCPTADVAGKCLTPANVVNFYYSTGPKAYTKESAEAKCNEKGWIPLP